MTGASGKSIRNMEVVGFLMGKKQIREYTLAAVRCLFPAAAAAVFLLLTEWIGRGTLDENVWEEFIWPHKASYALAWLFLLLIWLTADSLTHLAPLATLLSAGMGCIPATVNYYTLHLRGEPFLPWDLTQVAEAGGVVAAAGLRVQKSMVCAAGVILTLTAAAFFLYRGRKKRSLPQMLAGSAASAAALLALVFGVYLQPSVTLGLKIYPDAWMQDRYYRYYGVITGFMTNLTNLEINKPEDYEEETVGAVLNDVEEWAAIETGPLYPGSYGATAAQPEQRPTILYIMNESYWDVTELEDYGIEFDTDISPHLHALQETSAFGRCYSPSFGGGTCDVEFEALTGYSMAFLPAGSKPYQQHVTRPMFSLPNYLRTQGYQTAAVHCFYAKYWSRDTAYPNLGFDEFISLEDMPGAKKARRYYWSGGLVTDAEMAEQVIREYERLKQQSEAPVFLHAVTMQNHTNYNAANYPDEERVRVLSAPAGMKASTIGALEDFATGIRDADAMLGALTEYFSQVEEPVILVFWGDHYNPIDSGYDVYTLTGYAGRSSNDPALHQTTLLIWSNYAENQVDLGTIAAYDISPVMMELFGLEKPLYFSYLTRQLQVAYRSRTGGITLNRDGTATETLTAFQEQWNRNHWLLQYDLMFGREYALERMGIALEDGT